MWYNDPGFFCSSFRLVTGGVGDLVYSRCRPGLPTGCYSLIPISLSGLIEKKTDPRRAYPTGWNRRR